MSAIRRRKSSGTCQPPADVRQRIEAIEKKRLGLRMSRTELATAAGISERCIRDALRGVKVMRVSTLRRLEAALHGFAPASPELARTAYRALLVLLAREAGIEPEAVLAADPRRERGAVARARMRAFYILVTQFDLTMTTVARLAGVTKQAISKSLRDIEDERDEPALDAMLARVARQVGGKGG